MTDFMDFSMMVWSGYSGHIKVRDMVDILSSL